MGKEELQKRPLTVKLRKISWVEVQKPVAIKIYHTFHLYRSFDIVEMGSPPSEMTKYDPNRPEPENTMLAALSKTQDIHVHEHSDATKSSGIGAIDDDKVARRELGRDVIDNPSPIKSESSDIDSQDNDPQAASGSNLGRRGDPRMHKAVAARVANPAMSLLEALAEGGFEFPDNIEGSGRSDRDIYDADGVQLCQRKNQLSRRLRLLRKRDNASTSGANQNMDSANNPYGRMVHPNFAMQHAFSGMGAQPRYMNMMLQSQDNDLCHSMQSSLPADARLANFIQRKRALEEASENFLDQSGGIAGLNQRLRHGGDVMSNGFGEARSSRLSAAAMFGASNPMQQNNPNSFDVPFFTDASGTSGMGMHQQNIQRRSGTTSPAPAVTQVSNNDLSRYLELTAASVGLGGRDHQLQQMMMPQGQQQHSTSAGALLLERQGLDSSTNATGPTTSAGSSTNGISTTMFDGLPAEAKLSLAVELYKQERHDLVGRCLRKAGFQETGDPFLLRSFDKKLVGGMLSVIKKEEGNTYTRG